MDHDSSKSYLSVWSVAALGIGSMVGAGIFALMGQTVLVAGNDTYYSFIIGGIVALLSGYSYIKLGSRYPGSGGIIDYFDSAFSNKTISGTLSLIYLATLAISIALVGKAFGAYAARLFFPETNLNYLITVSFSSAIILFIGFLNMKKAGDVGRMEVILVVFKLIVLVLLIIAGVKGASTLVTETMPAPHWSTTLGSVGLTFFAYAGYGMMANTAGNLRNPQKTLPKAIFASIGIVLVLYVLLSYVVLKNIPPENLVKDADTAVAQAAKPLLGTWGFILVSLAALVASASAVNATFFSFLRISKGLADKRQLNRAFGKPFWQQGTRGYFFSILGILIINMVFDLSAIANIASVTFLISYLAVFVANWKLRKETGTGKLPIILGFATMLFVFITFIISLYQRQTTVIYIVFGFLAVCFLLELVLFKRLRKETQTKLPPQS